MNPKPYPHRLHGEGPEQREPHREHMRKHIEDIEVSHSEIYEVLIDIRKRLERIKRLE